MEPIASVKHYLRPKGQGIKLHLGCGDYWFGGFINIDHNLYGGTDMVWDIRTTLPFNAEVVQRIEAYEVIEHFNKAEVEEVLIEWMRLLMPGGTVKISVPDMDGLINMYKDNKVEALKMIYGYEDNPGHKWGYTKETLQELFEDNGFKNVVVTTGSMPERQNEPQLFLEAIK